eukprot:TRINITY_DN14573_c0_g1_i2.p1 TRINITY_DN14573_c0_g1~~TRINITY_DN14573_c0_g1_i2.p1  ORF type:complete len:499 (+),score=24.57 TRINITY_DN14573_c0_g1_i2:71-1567(+)
MNLQFGEAPVQELFPQPFDVRRFDDDFVQLLCKYGYANKIHELMPQREAQRHAPPPRFAPEPADSDGELEQFNMLLQSFKQSSPVQKAGRGTAAPAPASQPVASLVADERFPATPSRYVVSVGTSPLPAHLLGSPRTPMRTPVTDRYTNTSPVTILPARMWRQTEMPPASGHVRHPRAGNTQQEDFAQRVQARQELISSPMYDRYDENHESGPVSHMERRGGSPMPPYTLPVETPGNAHANPRRHPQPPTYQGVISSPAREQRDEQPRPQSGSTWWARHETAAHHPPPVQTVKVEPTKTQYFEQHSMPPTPAPSAISLLSNSRSRLEPSELRDLISRVYGRKTPTYAQDEHTDTAYQIRQPTVHGSLSAVSTPHTTTSQRPRTPQRPYPTAVALRSETIVHPKPWGARTPPARSPPLSSRRPQSPDLDNIFRRVASRNSATPTPTAIPNSLAARRGNPQQQPAAHRFRRPSLSNPVVTPEALQRANVFRQMMGRHPVN